MKAQPSLLRQITFNYDILLMCERVEAIALALAMKLGLQDKTAFSATDIFGAKVMFQQL